MVSENSNNIDDLIEKANKGDSDAQFELGYKYCWGEGVEQDCAKALDWYEKSAAQNNAIAQNNLGVMYCIGEGVEQNYAKAFEWFKKSALQNDAVAQNNLGCVYRDGQGIEQDYGKALEWFEKAASQNNADAQYNLGCMYYHGEGVEQDYVKAFEWFEKSASQNKSEAQNYLGCMYKTGEGVEQDYAKALAWYEKSAENGNECAQYNLGWMYYEGKGTEQNYENAVYWWEKSASQDDADSQFCLSCMYRDGLGVEKNTEKAKELWEKCKDSIDSETFYTLNEKFPKREGVEGEASMRNDNEYQIKNVKIVPGSSLAAYWKSDMQVVVTDKGDFIDKMPNDGGHDWQMEIGKSVECEIKESKGHKWICLLSGNQIYKSRTTKNSFGNDFVETFEQLPPDYDLNENPELVKTYAAIKQNTPVVFLTGGAGTGKSTFIKFLKNNLKADTNKKYVVLAPTGVAAINVGGQTIHSFFGFKGDVFEDSEIRKLPRNSVIDHVDLIIIDEISMVSSWMLDHIDSALRLWCDSAKPFGGKQMLLIGDCFQLPPIAENDEVKQKFFERWESPFFYAAKVFENIDFKAVQLKKIYRQKDDETFVHMLNRIRKCQRGYENDIEILNENCFIEKRLGTKNVPEECLLLTTKNRDAEQFNDLKMFNLRQKGERTQTFDGIVAGKFNFDHFLTPKKLTLCIGAKIMVTKNIASQSLANGDMGKVVDFGSDYVDVMIKDEKYRLYRETWQSLKYLWNENEKRIEQVEEGSFSQIPLKLGWAVTIHKSQGLTLDAVAIDAPDAWDSGQIYVALSRARNLNGIFLRQKIPVSAVKVNVGIKSFYERLFPEDEAQDGGFDDEYKSIVVDNSNYTVDTDKETTSVKIGGIDFELYPKQWERIQDHVRRTMSLLLAKQLIPEPEMKRLLEDYNYCYDTFGINWNGYKFTLLREDRNENAVRYWATNYSGYYICSQWYQDCSLNFAQWLRKLSEGKLKDERIDYTEEGVNWAKKRQEEKDKNIEVYLKQQKEAEERIRRSKEYAPINDKFLKNSYLDSFVRNSPNNNQGKKVVIKKTKPAKIPLRTFVAKRKSALVNGYCQFCLRNGYLEFADEKGMSNSSLPWANESVEILVYREENDILTEWEWRKK